jgi:hypothetical protein
MTFYFEHLCKGNPSNNLLFNLNKQPTPIKSITLHSQTFPNLTVFGVGYSEFYIRSMHGDSVNN